MKHFLFFLFVFPSLFAEHHAFVFEREQFFRPQHHESSVYYEYSPIYYPRSYHNIFALSAFQDSLAIEDGSVWQIDNYQSYQLRDWLINDPIIITQNREWFSSYQYRIINKTLSTSVPANLSMGPMYDSELSCYITMINEFRDKVILSDQSHWIVSPKDADLFSEWALNDYIIIGVNSGWDTTYPYILINSNMNNFVRAKQY